MNEANRHKCRNLIGIKPRQRIASGQYEGNGAVFSRLIGALARAFFMVLMVATPSLMLPTTTTDTAQIVAFLAIFAGVFTFFEYSSSYPSLVEFRDVSPFNRVRFIALFFTVFFLSMIGKGQFEPTVATEFVTAVGALIGQSIDFPFTPVRLMVSMMPPETDVKTLLSIRTAAGISYLTSLVSLTVFLMTLRLFNWPLKKGAFNVWVNLPTFDPTAGGDVVHRLYRDGRINIFLGFLLPFIFPAFVKLAANLFNPISLSDPQTLIWTVTAWAFLPASLFMRGIAMGRVAQMIEQKRKMAATSTEEKAGLAHA